MFTFQLSKYLDEEAEYSDIIDDEVHEWIRRFGIIMNIHCCVGWFMRLMINCKRLLTATLRWWDDDIGSIVDSAFSIYCL